MPEVTWFPDVVFAKAAFCFVRVQECTGHTPNNQKECDMGQVTEMSSQVGKQVISITNESPKRASSARGPFYMSNNVDRMVGP